MPANTIRPHDPRWKKFGELAGRAAYWGRRMDMQTVPGGMIPVDRHWPGMMRDNGVLDCIGIVTVHDFPGSYFPHRPN